MQLKLSFATMPLFQVNMPESLKKNMPEWMGMKYCIACGNGTDAIEIMLQAMGIGPGDEVIVPASSWIATSEAVSFMGAKPVFVDIDPQYFTLDPALIEAKVTQNTRAIIPVHLYGTGCRYGCHHGDRQQTWPLCH